MLRMPRHVKPLCCGCFARIERDGGRPFFFLPTRDDEQPTADTVYPLPVDDTDPCCSYGRIPADFTMAAARRARAVAEVSR